MTDPSKAAMEREVTEAESETLHAALLASFEEFTPPIILTAAGYTITKDAQP